MEPSKRTKPNGIRRQIESYKTNEANDLMHSGKKIANDFYQQSMDTLDETQEMVKRYSVTVWNKAHNHPLATSMILGGIVGGLSVLLYSLLKRK